MGASGTDVARAAADLVLLDDHFASIVAGIEQGRATYVNIRRFLTYHLTDNVAELMPFVVWMLSGGRFPLALGVLQILALDIGTDTLSAVALGAEPASPHLLDGPPVSGKLMNRTVLVRAFGVLGPTIAVASMAAFVVSMWALGWGRGPALAGRSGPGRRLGRDVHRDRARTEGERVRVPELDASSRSDRVADEPAAAEGDG